MTDRPHFRLWVRAADRRPDPEVRQTDGRTPVIIGTAIWALALVIVLLAPLPITAAERTAFAVTCAVGTALGPLALLYFRFKSR